MLLVAAGYDPAIEGLTGTDWEINTNALASKLGIFRNFKGSVAEPLSRDNAALLIYNALDVEMIESYTNNGYAMAYSDAAPSCPPCTACTRWRALWWATSGLSWTRPTPTPL